MAGNGKRTRVLGMLFFNRDEADREVMHQYIASRSDIRPCGQLKARQERCARSDRYPTKWQDDDFEPIAQAIDAIFEVMGWRK